MRGRPLKYKKNTNLPPTNVKIDLGNYTPWQQRFVDLIYPNYRFFILCLGRRSGKSELIQRLIASQAILNNNFKIGLSAPTFSKLMNLYDWFVLNLQAIIKEERRQEKVIKLLNNSEIRLFSLDAKGAVRSFNFNLFVVDEASQVKDLYYYWENEISYALADNKGKLIMTSTPLGASNDFSRLFYYGKHKENKEWYSLDKITMRLNPYIPRDELKRFENAPELIYKQEFLGEILPDGSSVFGDLRNCLIDANNIIDKIPIVYGVDIASRLDFTSIIGLNSKAETCYYNNFQENWTTTRIKVADIIKNTPTVLDATSFGGSMFLEDLRHLGCHRVEEFILSHSSKQEIIQSLQYAIKNGSIKINKEYFKIIEELNGFEVKYRDGGMFFGASSGLHDDDVISLALANSKLRSNFDISIKDIFVGHSARHF